VILQDYVKYCAMNAWLSCYPANGKSECVFLLFARIHYSI